ncbi:hypothetical protein [Nocardioides xinjiangensis]|uniref:hypothetical protein n=1 Tax=Nocardioides xinjiangensis TaxID=2817376 RepID=UPI001B30EB54|nr:hypothetical protein [Nocardioides sp. SYSU D00514]
MAPETLEQIAHRFVIDMLLQAQESYWLRRAEDFAKVGTPHADEIAQACRNKAILCREESTDEWAELLAVELGDVA